MYSLRTCFQNVKIIESVGLYSSWRALQHFCHKTSSTVTNLQLLGALNNVKFSLHSFLFRIGNNYTASGTTKINELKISGTY